MSLAEWFPAITTTSLAAVVFWLLRNLIVTRLRNSVEHEFNEKLERLRAELREADERLKADLRAKETEISMLRSGALSAMASRQIAIDKRKLEAIDQLWAAFDSLGPARALSSTMATLKFEEAAKLAEREPKARQMFEALGAHIDQNAFDHKSAAKARPFVSAMAWATYSAYMAICMHAVLRWHVLRFGLGAKDFADNDKIKELVVATLPHYKDYLEQHGSAAYYFVLEALEAKLLKEIEQMLAGKESDQASLEQAAEIVRISNALVAETVEKGGHS